MKRYFSINSIKKIMKEEGIKNISKDAGVKIEKMLEDYVRSLSKKAKRNALFDGRKKIKTEDIENY